MLDDRHKRLPDVVTDDVVGAALHIEGERDDVVGIFFVANHAGELWVFKIQNKVRHFLKNHLNDFPGIKSSNGINAVILFNRV